MTSVLLNAALLCFAILHQTISYPRNSEKSGWAQSPSYNRWSNAQRNPVWPGNDQSAEEITQGWTQRTFAKDPAYQTHHKQARKPYHFSYSTHGHDGGSAREEKTDENGRVTGWYTIVTADGHKRKVTYVADENGFRAKVETNEPGTANEDPANVQVKSHAAKVEHVESSAENHGNGWQQSQGWSGNQYPIRGGPPQRGLTGDLSWNSRSEPIVSWNSQRRSTSREIYRNPSPPPVKDSWNQVPINNNWYPPQW